jgi:hypothetical protein
VIDLIMYLYNNTIVSPCQLPFFAWIADAVEQRLPCQFGDYGVKLLRRAYHGQLNSVGRGHFEVGPTLYSRYKGAGVHIALHAAQKSWKQRRQGGG